MLHAATMPEADLLLIAGDYCPNFRGGETADGRQQVEWIKTILNPFLRSLPYKNRLIIAGNHDWCHYVDETKRAARRAIDATYLEDEFTIIDGVRFYGSPWQPWFYDWGFNLSKNDADLGYPHAKKIWSKISDKVDVLVTHGPPANIRDLCPDGRRVGCPILRERIFQVKPKLHIFGHIHEGYGVEDVAGVKFANVSLCDGAYRPVNPIQVFEV